ncbi:hypothetical protein [Nostoc sp.]|uniref:hypothetical protein n=1 Tax=Nostoc sp. TaxID=1180 RepID=UPI002FFBD63A
MKGKISVHLSGLELSAQNLSSGLDCLSVRHLDYYENVGNDKPFRDGVVQNITNV